MKIVAVILAFAMCGCSTTTTTTMRGKEIVKLEKKGWDILAFLGDLTAKVIVGTASNLAAEHLRADPARIGLRK